jgi:hypothetical protein
VSPESEIARLRDELDLSRRELAVVRQQLEDALEALAAERGRPAGATTEPARPPVLGRLADRLRRQAT